MRAIWQGSGRMTTACAKRMGRCDFEMVDRVVRFRGFDGRRVPGTGRAVRHYPEGEFVYGTFKVREVRFGA